MTKLFKWDYNSDQPYILSDEDKKNLRKGKRWAYIYLLLSNCIYFPYLFVQFLIHKVFSKHNNIKIDKKKAIGLCINLDKGIEQITLVEELGIKSLQLRVFLSDLTNLEKYVWFVKQFDKEKDFLITIIQDREHIEDKKLLEKDMQSIFKAFAGIVNKFQIGNAVNRIKWGFVNIEEYLDFYHTIQIIRDKNHPHIKLLGSAIIDFEYFFTIRTLFNSYNIHYDIFSSLLYVDRRGSPHSKQLGLFDLKNKIDFLDVIVRASSKSEKQIYITETNYPLRNTAPYAPTSEKECVSEAEYAHYMIEYFRIALKTNKVQKIYWHQLIAPGYGLIDNRNGIIRKTKAFYALKEFLDEKNTY